MSPAYALESLAYDRSVPTLRIVIRCDGSPATGAGHVTRCRALASALLDQGLEPIFVTRAQTFGLAILESAGFACKSIPTFGPENALEEGDLEATIAAAQDGGTACVLVDHYGAAPWYFEALRNAGLTLAVIDDVAERDLRAANWILNQNLGATDLPYRTSEDAVFLVEPVYALLRPEFGAARASLSREFSAEDRRVLVSLGGGDTANLCADVLSGLEAVTRPLEVRCIVTDSVIPATVERRLKASAHDVTLLRGVDDMAAQMTWADVSLNAGGSTCWELLCLGVPMIVVALSSDQRRIPQALEEAGLARRITSVDAAGQAVVTVLADPKERAEMSFRGQTLVDGRGAQRVATSLKNLVQEATNAHS